MDIEITNIEDISESLEFLGAFADILIAKELTLVSDEVQPNIGLMIQREVQGIHNWLDLVDCRKKEVPDTTEPSPGTLNLKNGRRLEMAKKESKKSNRKPEILRWNEEKTWGLQLEPTEDEDMIDVVDNLEFYTKLIIENSDRNTSNISHMALLMLREVRLIKRWIYSIEWERAEEIPKVAIRKT
jgi:hypothetical protein